MLRGCSVKPIGQGRIFYPGVIWTDMVDDRVEQNFHLLLVSRGNELLVVGCGAQMWIDSV